MAERRSDNHLYIAPELEVGAKIRVIGVGGGGCNAVNRMIEANVTGIEFIAVNTDHQVIERSHAENSLQIGDKVTRGLGAGADPDKGEMAANESRDEIAQLIKGSDMLFITAGMGGGTGTGAAPVIAQIARDMGILTVGVVTKPFGFEGAARKRNAEAGIEKLESFVDSLIIVPNDKLLEIADDDMGLDEAFAFADQILKYGVAGISDLVTVPGNINLDLADVRRVMVNAGICHMGIGRASGENRAMVAIDEAIHSPLLDSTIDGAKRVIINFTGANMKLKEVSMATSLVRDAINPDADMIWGTVNDPQMGDDIMITVIASGFENGRPERTMTQSTRGLELAPQGGRTAAGRQSQMPSFLNPNFAREGQAAQNAPESLPTQPVQNAAQPNASAQAPRPNYGRSVYKPLTPEPTNHRDETQRPARGQAPWGTNQASQPPKQKKGGIGSWLFAEQEDGFED